MLSLYRSSRASETSSEGETVIPAGTPYLTKVHGQLVLARHKKSKRVRAVPITGRRWATNNSDIPRPVETAIDLLGEAFGVRNRSTHRRAKSLDGPAPAPLMTGAVPYNSQQQLVYSTPPPRSVSAASTLPQIMPVSMFQQPMKYAVVQPNSAPPDLDQLRRIDAHYRSITGAGIPQEAILAPVVKPDAAKAHGAGLKQTVPITKHTCANCGRIRSRRYYSNHPIKPGETPVQEFCGRCQRDASCTSSSSRSEDTARDKYTKKKKKAKAKANHKRKPKTVSSDDDSSPESSTREKQQNHWSEKKVSSEKSSSESSTRENQQNHWSYQKVSSVGGSSKAPALEKRQNPRSKHMKATVEPTEEKLEGRYHSRKKNSTKAPSLDNENIASHYKTPEEEGQPRGRTLSRCERSDITKRPLSSLAAWPGHELPQEETRYERYDEPEIQQEQREPWEDRHESSHRSSARRYQDAPAHSPRRHPEESHRSSSRQPPVRHSYASSSRESRNMNKSNMHPTMSSNKKSGREHSHESRSFRSKTSPQRRSYERRNMEEQIPHHSEISNDVHSRPRDRVGVPTTNSDGYKPRMPRYTEDEDRVYENSDRPSSERSRAHRVQTEEPRSYQGYWAPDEVVQDMDDHTQRREHRRQRRTYRQDRYQDSEQSDLEYGNPLPTAPTPPPYPYHGWREQHEYESGVEDEGQYGEDVYGEDVYDEDVYDDIPPHQGHSSKSIYEQSFGKSPGRPTPGPFYGSIESLFDVGMDELEPIEEPAHSVLGSDYQVGW